MRYLTIPAALVMCVAIACTTPQQPPPRDEVPAPIERQTAAVHIVKSGETQLVSFNEYDSGSMHRSLPVSDFDEMPVLGAADYLLLYGEMPSGSFGTTVEVFGYERADDSFTSTRDVTSIDFFFAAEPQKQAQGQQVTKLSPKADVLPGTYFLHVFVGMDGDAYLGFEIVP